MPRWHVYPHHSHPGAWVADPPGFTRKDRGTGAWTLSGGRIFRPISHDGPGGCRPTYPNPRLAALDHVIAVSSTITLQLLPTPQNGGRLLTLHHGGKTFTLPLFYLDDVLADPARIGRYAHRGPCWTAGADPR